MEEATMDVSEFKMVASVLEEDVEIWVESEVGLMIPITDYDFDLENNRIILRITE